MKEEQAAFSVTASSTNTWHIRLGHFPHSGMSYMLKNQLVRGVPLLTEKLAECEACQFGKQTRKPFPESSWRVKRDKLDKRAEPGVFIGYSTISKAYRIFQPQTGIILISRDVHFMEDESWCWSDSKKNQNYELELEDTIDDPPVRGTRLLSDIYQRSNAAICNIAVCEPASVEEAVMKEKWLAAMQEELSMIEKNQTWELVSRPHDRNEAT
ncbi:hypothetical protein L6164_021005 [Bauhinia variegata]|uniref:Uncharacterized protein n=1 Tax=Bauhinia variegata TaxID=167791 RepID=A0ACB9N255_BAUVA|nr:hypothetical protein L6164_021005 [Bauhinia variegata]